MARATKTGKKVGDGAKVTDSSQQRRRSPRGVSTPPGLPPTAKRTERGVTDSQASKARKQSANDSPAAAAPTASPNTAPPDADSGHPADAAHAANETVAENGHGAGKRGGSSRAGSSDTSTNGIAPDVSQEDEVDGEGEENRDVPAAPVRPNARREAFAQVARARGAHFARPDKKNASSVAAGAGNGNGRARGRYSSGAADGGSGRGVGSEGAEGPKELWPGPFAEARRLMDNREAAAARREAARVNGEAAAASDDDSDRDEDEAAPTVKKIKVDWKPRGRGSRSGKSKVVPSLFRLCLDLLADKFDHIESLGDVSPEVRNHLASVLCRQLKLTTEALQRLSEPGVLELILPDCSRIEPDQMRASLLQCRGSLRVLRLGTCGRCLGDATIKALVAAGGLPRLETAVLAGTYHLTDTGVLELLGCCPRLTCLEIPANSRLTKSSLEAMVDKKRPVGSALTSLSLSDCIELGPEELESLKDMCCLESLSLSGVTKLTDATLGQSLEACGWKLRHLDISDCVVITDASLHLIGELCGVLESLKLGMCPLLTNGAIQELFQYSGSSADVACDDRHESTVTVATVSSCNGSSSSSSNSNKGKGKKPSHGKGKGKNSTANVSPPPSPEDDDDRDGDHDEGKDEGGVAERAGSSARRRVSREKGHAMLKSRLTKVSLRGLVQIEDGAVMAMTAACSDGLRELDLKGVALVSDNSLVSLAQFCSSSLESLDLSFCRAVTDDGLGHLVDACPRLRSLRLWGCTQIGDRFLKGHSREDLIISRY